MPPATATFEDAALAPFGIPNGTFLQFRLQVCPPLAFLCPATTFPVILFSPALGTSRLLYSALLQWIASAGFTVIALDHPYDADIVEFPDGALITSANITTDAQLAVALKSRVQDSSFVLDQLSLGSIALMEFPPRNIWAAAGMSVNSEQLFERKSLSLRLWPHRIAHN
jgi:hypothetical protein